MCPSLGQLFRTLLHSDRFQDNVKEWLSNIGLKQYYINFQRSHIVSRSHLEILRSMSQEDVKKELNITKPGNANYISISIFKIYLLETESRYISRKQKQI